MFNTLKIKVAEIRLERKNKRTMRDVKRAWAVLDAVIEKQKV